MVDIVSLKPHASVVKQIVCRGCGATLEYVPNDVKVWNGKDYSGGSAGQEWIDCPNCKKEVMIRNW